MQIENLKTILLEALQDEFNIHLPYAREHTKDSYLEQLFEAQNKIQALILLEGMLKQSDLDKNNIIPEGTPIVQMIMQLTLEVP